MLMGTMGTLPTMTMNEILTRVPLADMSGVMNGFIHEFNAITRGPEPLDLSDSAPIKACVGLWWTYMETHLASEAGWQRSGPELCKYACMFIQGIGPAAPWLMFHKGAIHTLGSNPRLRSAPSLKQSAPLLLHPEIKEQLRIAIQSLKADSFYLTDPLLVLYTNAVRTWLYSDLKSLPLELLCDIYERLGPVDRLRLGATSTYFTAVAEMCKVDHASDRLDAVRKDGRLLEHIPTKYKTAVMCTVALLQSVDAVRFIPDTLWDTEIRPSVDALQELNDIWTLDVVDEKYTKTEALCVATVSRHPFVLETLPDDKKTRAVCFAAIQVSGAVLRWVPEHVRTKEMYMLAVKCTHGSVLKFIKKEHRTHELCMESVKYDAYSLQYVPKKCRTPELYRAAVQTDGSVIDDVPTKYRTPELYRAAVQTLGFAIDDVPTKYRTPELYRAAIQSGADVLKHVPDALRTYEMCKSAVQARGCQYSAIPSDKKSKELLMIAIRKGYGLDNIPKDLRTDEIYMAAIQADAGLLLAVPRRLRTYEMYTAAVQLDGGLLRLLLKEECTLDVCLYAVENNGMALEYVPKDGHIKTMSAIYMAAVKNDGLALQFVPLKDLSDTIIRAAVTSNGMALQYVPRPSRDWYTCLIAVKNKGMALVHAPTNDMADDFHRMDIYTEAVRNDGVMLQIVPEYIRTKRMYVASLKNRVRHEIPHPLRTFLLTTGGPDGV